MLGSNSEIEGTVTESITEASYRYLQEELVRSYNLPFEIVGTKAETRLRILPRGFISGEAERQIGKEWTRNEVHM